MYHSEKNFIDPFAFLPERWLGQDERFAEDKGGILQPFSYGPRNCIGKKYVGPTRAALSLPHFSQKLILTT